MDKLFKLPAIILDIDGVLVRDGIALPHAEKTVKHIRQHLHEIDSENFSSSSPMQLPVMCITNAGYMLEQKKAESLNKVLNLQEKQHQFKQDEMVLSYTAIRRITPDLTDKVVLVAGMTDLHILAESCGLNKYITVEEYAALYPFLVPNSKRKHEDTLAMRPVIMERLRITDEKAIEEPLQIGAIIIFSDVTKWDEAVQIMCDLISSNDGTISDKFPEVSEIGIHQHIPIYACGNDFTYPGKFKLPRIVGGGYMETFKLMSRKLYGFEPKITFYGKPEVSSFRYTEDLVRKKWSNSEITNFYMIGDNPYSDIQGARSSGWKSILVRTGLFKGKENHEIHPADYVVDDVREAVDLILKLENFKTVM
jgi:HAD superfamily hydrolase (TIGR01456 family)